MCVVKLKEDCKICSKGSNDFNLKLSGMSDGNLRVRMGSVGPGAPLITFRRETALFQSLVGGTK